MIWGENPLFSDFHPYDEGYFKSEIEHLGAPSLEEVSPDLTLEDDDDDEDAEEEVAAWHVDPTQLKDSMLRPCRERMLV